MKTTTLRGAMEVAFGFREVAPPSVKSHFRLRFPTKTKPTPQEAFDEAVQEYLAEVAEFETQSKQGLYDNPEAAEVEYRIHCAWLAHLIETGQLLVLYAHQEGLSGDGTALKLVQEKINVCIHRIHDWHGAPGTHVDEPPSFKQAMDEVARGEVEDCDL
jgi:hypothetical protein